MQITLWHFTPASQPPFPRYLRTSNHNPRGTRARPHRFSARFPSLPLSNRLPARIAPQTPHYALFSRKSPLPLHLLQKSFFRQHHRTLRLIILGMACFVFILRRSLILHPFYTLHLPVPVYSANRTHHVSSKKHLKTPLFLAQLILFITYFILFLENILPRPTAPLRMPPHGTQPPPEPSILEIYQF